MAGLDKYDEMITGGCDDGKKLFDTLRYLQDPVEAEIVGHRIAEKAAKAAYGIRVVAGENAFGELETLRAKRATEQRGPDIC